MTTAVRAPEEQAQFEQQASNLVDTMKEANDQSASGAYRRHRDDMVNTTLWEYRCEPVSLGSRRHPPTLAEVLNERGQEGWELVQILPAPDDNWLLTCVFKRSPDADDDVTSYHLMANQLANAANQVCIAVDQLGQRLAR